jgi:hemerythrin superfamily protein
MTHHQDAISLLTEDHRTVEQLFADYERGLQGPEAKRQVVDQLIRELSVHAAIEEAYFYPEVRKALGEGGELVEESLHEHQEVKETLAALEDMDPADAAYDQQVAALIADVRHHVEEEEGEMFPKLRAALSAEQLHDIGEKLADGKAKAPTHPHPAAPASGPGPRWPGRPPAWSTGSGTSWATVPRTRAPSRFQTGSYRLPKGATGSSVGRHAASGTARGLTRAQASRAHAHVGVVPNPTI